MRKDFMGHKTNEITQIEQVSAIQKLVKLGGDSLNNIKKDQYSLIA